jgi:hypothetical protein
MQLTENSSEPAAGTCGPSAGASLAPTRARCGDHQRAERDGHAIIDMPTVRLVRRPARRPRIVWPARGPALTPKPTGTAPWRRALAARLTA